jgi:hypothetical protein
LFPWIKGQMKYSSWTYTIIEHLSVCLFDLWTILLFTRYSHESVNLTIKKNQTHVRQVSHY